MKERCEEHPRYRGKGQPQTGCCQCWYVWISGWPTKPSDPLVNILRKFKTAVLRERPAP